MKIALGPMIALVLFAAPSALRAEPIPWNYSSTVTVNGGPAWLAAFPDQVIAGGTVNSIFNAQVWGNSGGWVPLSGTRVVTVGEAHPGADLSPDNPLVTHAGFASAFDFLFNLQDAKSGQTGSLHFLGGVEDFHEISETTPFVPLNRRETIFNRDSIGTGPWLASTSLRLGENDYTVDLKEREDGFGTAFIDADVRVNAVHETPEPATLLLGGHRAGRSYAGLASEATPNDGMMRAPRP